MNLDSDLRLDKPELKVSVNREKIVDVGASVETVGRTLETMLGGRQVTRFKRDGEQYDVIVQVADGDRRLARRHLRHLRARQGQRDDPALQPGDRCARAWRPRT